MVSVLVERLTFNFPDGWRISKYDDWSFYRNQVSRMWQGIKALDLLAIDDNRTAWLIEVKDYRRQVRTKPTELGDEVARKVFDTLAAMLPAAINANDDDERETAKQVIRVGRLRVVLHLEQPAKQSTLRPRAIDPASVKQQLKALLRPIDAHPIVAETGRMGSLSWSVT